MPIHHRKERRVQVSLFNHILTTKLTYSHMTCKKCKWEFCWVCMGPWSEHGTSWYNCNRFDEKSGVEARDAQTKSRTSLDRYLHVSQSVSFAVYPLMSAVFQSMGEPPAIGQIGCGILQEYRKEDGRHAIFRQFVVDRGPICQKRCRDGHSSSYHSQMVLRNGLLVSYPERTLANKLMS